MKDESRVDDGGEGDDLSLKDIWPRNAGRSSVEEAGGSERLRHTARNSESPTSACTQARLSPLSASSLARPHRSREGGDLLEPHPPSGRKSPAWSSEGCGLDVDTTCQEPCSSGGCILLYARRPLSPQHDTEHPDAQGNEDGQNDAETRTGTTRRQFGACAMMPHKARKQRNPQLCFWAGLDGPDCSGGCTLAWRLRPVPSKNAPLQQKSETGQGGCRCRTSSCTASGSDGIQSSALRFCIHRCDRSATLSLARGSPQVCGFKGSDAAKDGR